MICTSKVEPQMNAVKRSLSRWHPSNLRSSAFICSLIIYCCTGCAGFRELGERFTGEPKKQATMLRSTRPDDRRDAILFFVDHGYGREETYTRLYRQMAEFDTDPLVRATAIRALNRSRDKKATPLFIASLSDKNVWVRLEAAKALNRVPDPNAAPALLKVVNSSDEQKDVRIAAAEALQSYRNVEVGRQLVALLNVKDFGLAWQARRSLKFMTGKDLSYDETAWLNFITGPTKPLG